jgi:hypothetical protein
LNRTRTCFTALKRFAIRTAALVGLLAYTLVFSEFFIRLFAPQPIMPRYVTATPWGVRGNVPGAQYWQTSPEVHVQIRINQQGIRDDREFAFKKQTGSCRIAMFGDSFLMGYELDLTDTFAARLEAELRARGYKVEVINFAVSGFGTAEMLLTYKYFARHFDPDIVLLGWNTSDFDDNIRSRLYRLVGDRLTRDQPTFVPSMELQRQLMQFWIYRWAQDNSHLYSLLRERVGVLAKRAFLAVNLMRYHLQTNASESGSGEDVADNGPTKPSIELSAALLQHAKRLIEADGRELVIVDVPAGFVSSFESQLKSLRSDFNAVLPAEAFRASARAGIKLFWETGSQHLTPEGARILVEETEKVLLTSAKLSSCRAVVAGGG